MSVSYQISDDDINAFLAAYNSSLSDDTQLLEFDERRRAAITRWGDLQACPGSGKTTLVAAKLMILAGKWRHEHRGVCVLTHTNVAKNEIISRLERHLDGYKLLSYPHFIGTFQEFINRHIAVPYLRSVGLPITWIDDEKCAQFSNRLLGIGTRTYLERRNASISGLRLDRETGQRQIPTNPNEGTNAYQELTQNLTQRLKNGYFCFSEMYYFANRVLQENGSLHEALRNRFSVVLIDEMQDTQKHQDDLINSIFAHDDINVQRFGDPDQAIFDGIGGEHPNETFNENPDLNILAHSYRFTEDIASRASRFSLSEIGDIEALAIEDEPVRHRIILFDEESKTRTLETFANIVAEYDQDSSWSCIKAVGATEGQGGHISSYWSDYDRNRSVSHPRPKKLIDTVNREWWKVCDHSAEQYRFIIQAILDLLRISDINDTRIDPPRHFNKLTLKSWLLESDKSKAFKAIITNWIVKPPSTQEQWSEQTRILKAILGLPETAQVNSYLDANGCFNQEPGMPDAATSNVYIAENGREIEVGTIHSVKGETHDATLILETRNHRNDLEIMLPYLTGDLPSADLQNDNLRAKPHHSANPPQNKQFLRQLYVAASRPRHLICLAMHKDHINDEQITTLRQNGWEFRSIYEVDHG